MKTLRLVLLGFGNAGQAFARLLLEKAMDHLQLSARAYSRILKVARTIADMSGDKIIRENHIAEAISYRMLDRSSWGV